MVNLKAIMASIAQERLPLKNVHIVLKTVDFLTSCDIILNLYDTNIYGNHFLYMNHDNMHKL